MGGDSAGLPHPLDSETAQAREVTAERMLGRSESHQHTSVERMGLEHLKPVAERDIRLTRVCLGGEKSCL
jgi:hypothetical protein